MDATLQQLTIYDAFEEREREPDVDEMPRLGDGPELGLLLLQPLFAKGWRLHKKPQAFAAERGVYLWILHRSSVEVKAEGRTLGEVATQLFAEAGRMSGELDTPTAAGR